VLGGSLFDIRYHGAEKQEIKKYNGKTKLSYRTFLCCFRVKKIPIVSTQNSNWEIISSTQKAYYQRKVGQDLTETSTIDQSLCLAAEKSPKNQWRPQP